MYKQVNNLNPDCTLGLETVQASGNLYAEGFLCIYLYKRQLSDTLQECWDTDLIS